MFANLPLFPEFISEFNTFPITRWVRGWRETGFDKWVRNFSRETKTVLKSRIMRKLDGWRVSSHAAWAWR